VAAANGFIRPAASPRALRISTQRSAATMDIKEIKTVSETMRDFTASYPTPIVPAYRSIVMDLLTTTHLARVDTRYKYDPIFALGMAQIFVEFFKAYPGGTEQTDKIFVALVSALELDAVKAKEDAAAAMEWAKGKDAAALEALFETPDSGPVGSYVAAVKASDDFLYTRVFGVGLFKLFADAGIETVDNSVLTKFAGILGFSAVKFQQDYDLYSGSLDKLRAVEQLFKEIEIREKKKLAARLEEKAAKAAAAAETARAVAAGEVPEEVDETPRVESPPPAAEQQSAEV